LFSRGNINQALAIDIAKLIGILEKEERGERSEEGRRGGGGVRHS
jgi:phage anti-repressor protein